MARNVRVRGIRRKQIDEDKLALAFLLLAKILHEQESEIPSESAADRAEVEKPDEPEAA